MEEDGAHALSSGLVYFLVCGKFVLTSFTTGRKLSHSVYQTQLQALSTFSFMACRAIKSVLCLGKKVHIQYIHYIACSFIISRKAFSIISQSLMIFLCNYVTCSLQGGG